MAWVPPDWKAIARRRIKERLAPLIREAQESIAHLEANGIIKNAFIRAGLAEHVYTNIHEIISDTKRYVSEAVVDSVVAEFRLRELVDVESIKKFELPD